MNAAATARFISAAALISRRFSLPPLCASFSRRRRLSVSQQQTCSKHACKRQQACRLKRERRGAAAESADARPPFAHHSIALLLLARSLFPSEHATTA